MITIRGLKAGTNAIIMVLIVFVILILFNIIMMRFLIRLDLTEGNIYSISKSTKNVLKKLDDIVNVKGYFSEDLPPQLTTRIQQVKDILSEYQAYGQGNLQIEYIDPKSDPKIEEKMRFTGIQKVQAQVLEQDKVTAQGVYLGVAVLYEDKKQTIPFVQNVNTFEYDLTSAILKVASPEEKTIGFLTGHDERDIYDDERDGYGEIRVALQKQYSVTTADTTSGNKVRDNINTLIVAGPKKTLSERDKYEIDQFIMRGGRALFLVDPINPPAGAAQATPLRTGLNDLLEHYGVKLGNNLVVDMKYRAMATFLISRFSQITQPYPLFPKVLKDNFNKEHIITSQLESLPLPWTSSLEIVAPKSDELKAVELANTSEAAWEMHSPYNLNPQQQFYQTPSDLKTLTLAVELSGKFKSFYADKDIPKVEKDDEEGGKEEPDDSKRETIREVENTKIIVIGNSNFINNSNLSGDNSVFFLNAVDWLTLGEDLVNIRSRTATERPLKEVSSGIKNFIKFICTLGIPIIVIALGVVKFLMRRRAKKMFEVYSAR